MRELCGPLSEDCAGSVAWSLVVFARHAHACSVELGDTLKNSIEGMEEKCAAMQQFR